GMVLNGCHVERTIDKVSRRGGQCSRGENSDEQPYCETDRVFPGADILDSIMRNFLADRLNVPHFVVCSDLSQWQLTAVLVLVQVLNCRFDAQRFHDSPPFPVTGIG